MELSHLYPWINFLVFSGILFYFLKEPIRDFLGDRRENLRKELETVAKERGKVEKKFQEYRKKLAEAETTIDQLKKELRHEGGLEKTSLIKKAQSFAQKIREDGAKVGDQELNRTKLFLKKRSLLLAVELAKEWVEKSIGDTDQERLLGIAIEHLEKEKSERKGIS